MTKNLKISIIIAGVLLLIASGLFIFSYYAKNKQMNSTDKFAQCLKDKGVKFYGSWQCPHCIAQKEMFGVSKKYLPYTECAEKDGRTQTKACEDAGIRAYPTWRFSDGTEKTGRLSIETLAQRTGCPLSK
jgi:histidinol phosphatase-like enzyme